MITREQVADLRPGDVVELRDERWPDVVTRGPLEQDMGEWLSLGGVVVASHKEGIAGLNRQCTLTVVSRAPRPLYVNHPRSEPVPGDVGQGGDDRNVYLYRPARGFLKPQWWFWDGGTLAWTHTDRVPALRLLVDGESGLPPAVQS